MAFLLGVLPGRLSTAVWSGRLPEPQRVGDAFAWSERDILAAAKLFGLSWRPTPPAPPRDLVQMTIRPPTSATAPVPTPAGRDRTFGIEAKP